MQAVFSTMEELDAFLKVFKATPTRFTVGELRTKQTRTRSTLSFHIIRLKESKPYCGNHPAGCEFTTDRTPARRNFLEGADWVAFNDLLNDCADSLSLSCNISSAFVDIRQGPCRRTYYDADWESMNPHTGIVQLWEKIGLPEHYVDRRGQPATRSDYPEGTPGRDTYVV
jgi:hypothetical protein